MAKQRRSRIPEQTKWRPPAPASTEAAPVIETEATELPSLDELNAEVAEVVATVGIEEPSDDDIDATDLGEQLVELGRLRKTYRVAIAELEQREADLTEQATVLGHQDAELGRRTESLNRREADVIARELDAANGFAVAEAGWIEGFTERRRAVEAKARDSLGDAFAALDQQRTELVQSHALRIAKLEAWQLEVDEQERELRRLRREVSVAQSLLDDEQAEASSTRDDGLRVAELARERAEREADRLRDALLREESLRADLELQLRRLGRRTPEQIEADEAELRGQIRDLEDQLRLLPSAEEAADIGRLKESDKKLRKELRDLRDALLKQTDELEDGRRAQRELQLAKKTKDGYEATIRAFEHQLGLLRQELQVLGDDRRAQAPFPQCTALDEDPRPRPVPDRTRPDLATLAHEVRHRMAAEGLFYEPRSVQSFLAGMAVSPLHVLQGLSGTGKSSLPQAFARAIGASSEVVAVQAGWRDRQELLGYYNPFESRFVETKFLEKLYEAQCDHLRDLPVFIVLDEMNLSHPEQYFADFLSELERDEDERRIRLMSFQHRFAPRRLIGGVDLAVPPNVWFIGTANHDDTTASLAPKTYDRAHVMELPDRYAPFAAVDIEERDPIPVAHLRREFARATERHLSDVNRLADVMNTVLGASLRDEVRVAWGNRIPEQLKRYASVVVASGGNLSDALDDFIAFKILYKLRGQHRVTKPKLDNIEKSLDATWHTARLPGSARRSKAFLDAERAQKFS